VYLALAGHVAAVYRRLGSQDSAFRGVEKGRPRALLVTVSTTDLWFGNGDQVLGADGSHGNLARQAQEALVNAPL
jgi:hypothetical protein